MSAVLVGVLFPATFNLNADAANATQLVKRLTLSGLDAEVVPVDADVLVAGTSLDALVIGSPSSSVLASPDSSSQELHDFVTTALIDDVPILAVSNGFHLLGTMTAADGSDRGGLGIIPVSTTFGPQQHVTIGAEVNTEWGDLIGIENHNATVSLDADSSVFGSMTFGVGNNTGGAEGFHRATLWATHLHGPLFAMNPTFADLFAMHAAAHRGLSYSRSTALDDIDRLAEQARGHLVRKRAS